MLPNGLDLGETVHVIRKASIRLSSSCSIALEDHPFISPRASKLLLCSPSHRNAWVHRGQSLELAIEVSWNRSFVDESEVDRVLEYICNALGDAELWAQLALSVKLKTSQLVNAGLDFGATIHLSISHDDSLASRAGLTGLDGGLALHGLADTDALIAVPLNRVEIRMQFSQARPPSRAQRIARSNASFDDKPHSQPIHASSSEHVVPDRSCYSQPAEIGGSDEILFDDFGDFESGFSATNGRKSPLDLDACIRLIDASLRTFVGGREAFSSVTEKRNVKSRLMEVSPNIFSPGYLQAVAQRTLRLPKVLAPFLAVQRNARYVRFKGASESDGGSQQLKTNLFCVAQKHLFNPKAGLRLKPLVAKQVEIEPLSRSDEILMEADPEQEAEDQSLLSSEDERLLLLDAEENLLVDNMRSQGECSSERPDRQAEQQLCERPEGSPSAMETDDLTDEDDIMDF